MKTTMLMIPLIALGAMGMKADKTAIMPILKQLAFKCRMMH